MQRTDLHQRHKGGSVKEAIQALKDLQSAYIGATLMLADKPGSWEGKIRSDAKVALDSIEAALEAIHDWTLAPGSKPDPAEVRRLLNSIR